MKRALISVSDKTNIVEFSRELVNLGYEIISTGGTKKELELNNIKVTCISEFTGFPEILDGRVKTLHPYVHGGLLSIRDNDEHVKQVIENGIKYIDMVVVNLYPFKKTIDKPGVTLEEAIENIDIGGPSMLRSAAKNYRDVTVVCDCEDYAKVLEEIKETGNTLPSTRQNLALKVFTTTSQYDSYISNYLATQVEEDNRKTITLTYDLISSLRYGENPHQKAKFYKDNNNTISLTNANIIQGKELSYNNIQDANAALQIAIEFKDTVVVAVKHMNPCGVGVGADLAQAWDRAYKADSTSIFGGIIATNAVVTEEVAAKMAKIFLEVIIAPSFTKEALAIFSKKPNLRLLELDFNKANTTTKQVVQVLGGVLIQDYDNGMVTKEDLVTVTNLVPSKEELDEMLFAWKVVKHVKSNAIVISKDGMTVGVGAGQMNRVGSARIALEWARQNGHTEGLTMASDAFFPFDDVVKLASEYGVTNIIQPGGSIKDQDSINTCNDLGIKMVFTKMRHFKH